MPHINWSATRRMSNNACDTRKLILTHFHGAFFFVFVFRCLSSCKCIQLSEVSEEICICVYVHMYLEEQFLASSKYFIRVPSGFTFKLADRKA